MERKFIVILTIFLIIPTGINISGCIGSSCGYTDSKIVSPDATLTLNDIDLDHRLNFTQMEIIINVTYNNEKQILWRSYYIEESFGDDPYNMTFNFIQIEDIRNRYSFRIGRWQNFSIGFQVQSNDDYIINKTFFNDTTIISGEILIESLSDDDWRSQIRYDQNYTGELEDEGHGSSFLSHRINIITTEWNVRILLASEIACQNF